MKRLFLPIALAVATAMPLVAGAQQAPPPPDGGPPPMTDSQRSQMRANMEQMRKAHEEFRTQVLAALTPAHRQLLASIAGSLAVAPQPDYRGAVAQLDAALSQGEKDAILSDDKQMRDRMESMRPADAPARPPGKRPHRERTAGAVLLGLTGGHPMMRGGWR